MNMIPRFLYLALTRARNFLLSGRADLPTAIGIATATACNRRCHYCPQSQAPKPTSFMPDAVWRTVLNRLVEARWRGIVCPVWYQEPGMQPNFLGIVGDIRAALPRAVIIVPSNGDFPDQYPGWIQAGVSRILVTEHPPFRPAWRKRLDPVARRFPARIAVRRIRDDQFHDHAGRVELDLTHMTSCTEYSSGMPVAPDGKVCLCCLDYDNEMVMGDLTKQALLDVWDDPFYRSVRRNLARGVPYSRLCRNCFGKPDDLATAPHK